MPNDMQVMNSGHYAQIWKLSDLKLLHETPTSHVFKAHYKDRNVILKLLNSDGRKFEAKNPAYLNAAQNHGAIHILKHDQGAVLMPFLDGDTLKHQKPYNDELATDFIGETLKQLHKAKIPNNVDFETLEHRFSFMNDYTNTEKFPPILSRAKKLADYMVENFPQSTLLHGDMHHDNIIHDTQLGWRVIDPQPIIGDLAYDCANTFKNPLDMTAFTHNKDRLLKQADSLARILDIDPRRIINYAFIHGCLSSCWSHDYNNEKFQNLSALKTSQALEEFITEDLQP
jgi:streptomycin 6-kinase